MTMDILLNTMRMLHDAKILGLSPLLSPANVKMSFLTVREHYYFPIMENKPI